MTGREPELLAAARAGDAEAYARLVAPYRGELHAHCARMLGSAHDAEDALQETLLRAWRGLGRFEQRAALRSWLYRIATNCALTVLQRRTATVAAQDVAEPADAADLEAGAQRRDGLERALLAAHAHLPPRQRTVLILREAFDFSAPEVAASLRTTTASVNSALQRARATVGAQQPAIEEQPSLRTVDDARLREHVRRCAEAWAGADVDGVVALLAQDAA
jgi:RNA polymerase sigma-70 factor (ECF subfamily)